MLRACRSLHATYQDAEHTCVSYELGLCDRLKRGVQRTLLCVASQVDSSNILTPLVIEIGTPGDRYCGPSICHGTLCFSIRCTTPARWSVL